MKVSVIIAAYNIQDYIERCLLSVIKQTLKEIEIIVVNDGSSDGTLEKLNILKEFDSRIKIINKENEGVIEARKTGLKLSQGDYVLFIDGDDWIDLNTIKLLKEIALEGNYDIVCYNGKWVYDNYIKEFDVFNKKKLSDNLLKDLLLDYILPGLPFKLIKKDFILKNNIQFPNNISYAEDLAIIANCFIHNPKVGYCNNYLYNYFQRSDSLTKRISIKMQDINEAFNYIENRLIENSLLEKYIKEFERAIFIHMFVRIVLDIPGNSEIQKNIYIKYKEKKIKIFKNRYIKDYIYKQSISMKLRIITYNYNYKLGNIYDILRIKFKNILSMQKYKYREKI